MPDRMPEDMPDRMPDRMPEDMSDRMPEDLPVTKCINVMVGITRSKVIDCIFFEQWRLDLRGLCVPTGCAFLFPEKNFFVYDIWVVHVVFTSFAGPDLKYRFPLPARVSIYNHYATILCIIDSRPGTFPMSAMTKFLVDWALYGAILPFYVGDCHNPLFPIFNPNNIQRRQVD